MNYADFFTSPNGFPLESDATLGFMQTDYQNAIKGLAAFFGEEVIISGLVETPTTASDGWIFLNGDLIFFEGGVKSATYIIEEVGVEKANENGDLIERYITKKARFGSGGTTYNWADLQRLEGLQALQNRVIDIIAFEDEVVLSGCAVSSVDDIGFTLAISAGVVMIDRKFLSMPAYAGGYPVYANSDGEWVNSPPGSDFITFNPYTSQRYADVVSRAGTVAGEVRMRVALSDRFETSGLGRWEMLGWAIANGSNGTVDMRSRFPVAYDNRIGDPGGNIWDVAYNTPGTNGGEKLHTLTIAEMPAHRHTNDVIGEGDQGMITLSETGDSTTVSSPDSINSGDEPNVRDTPEPMDLAGGGGAHENRPPFKVFVFIQRI
jgi:hypothetical protein